MYQHKQEKITGDLFSNWAETGRGEKMAEGHAPLVRALLEEINVEGKSVLDIGCGIGEALKQCVRKGAINIAGIDLSTNMIDLAQNNLPEGDFKMGSVLNLPWKDDQFDHVISIEAMYYFTNIQKALSQIMRVLKKGGQFSSAIEYYVDNKATAVWAEELPMNILHFSEKEWIEVFKKAGYRNVYTKRIIRYNPKAKKDFIPSAFFPDYQWYLDYIQSGALMVCGTK